MNHPATHLPPATDQTVSNATRRAWLRRTLQTSGVWALAPGSLTFSLSFSLSLPALALKPSELAAAPSPSSEPAATQRPLAAKSLLLGLCAAGSRWLAVGERGHILLSDDAGQSWRQAKSVPTRNTLTAVHASSAQQIWACGHGGTLLRSDDAGETWQRLALDTAAQDVFLTIHVQADGLGLAAGGFGLLYGSRDGGKTWAAVQGLEALGEEHAQRHLNQIAVQRATTKATSQDNAAAPDTWWLAAEGGVVLRCTTSRAEGFERGWEAIKTPYRGSLWCVLPITIAPAQPGIAASVGLIVGGMRGNWGYSRDGGRQWTWHSTAELGSLTSACSPSPGVALLAGLDNSLLRITWQQATNPPKVERLNLTSPSTLTAIATLPGPPTTLLSCTPTGPRRLTATDWRASAVASQTGG